MDGRQNVINIVWMNQGWETAVCVGESGVGEGCLLAALSVRSCNFAAMGCLAKLLSATTAWAFAKSGTPLPREEGLLHFGEAADFAAAVLCAYRCYTDIHVRIREPFSDISIIKTLNPQKYGKQK